MTSSGGGGSMVALVSGASAGLAVDITLFPLDTIKTRLQSQVGFQQSGAFRKLYAGIGPVLLGSAPGAAVFFVAYERTRSRLGASLTGCPSAVVDMAAAAAGEVAACVVRVPVEVVKQRTQAGGGTSSARVLVACLRADGVRGLFRGYVSTVLREIPFSFVQFPIWEWLRREVARRRAAPGAWDSACCGFVAGGLAAAVTTPLDVAKTRIMLAQRRCPAARGRVVHVLVDCVRTEGYRALFAGLVPRVTAISVGGFVFLGVYDRVSRILFGRIA